jgi:hypothetical protein
MKRAFSKGVALLLCMALFLNFTPIKSIAQSNENYPKSEAIEALVDMYYRVGVENFVSANNGTGVGARGWSALGYRSLTDDSQFEAIDTIAPIGYEEAAQAALNSIAVKNDPREYYRPSGGIHTVYETVDLIDMLLNQGLMQGGAFQNKQTFSSNSNESVLGSTQLHALLALEAYFGGADWQNNAGVTRSDAIKVFLSYIRDFSGTSSWNVHTNLEGARYYFGSTSIPNPLQHDGQTRRMQLKAVILLSRWLDDETDIDGTPLKTIAAREIDGLLITYKATHSANGDANNSTSFVGTNANENTNRNNINRFLAIQDVHYYALYISALIAAGRQEIESELMQTLFAKIDAARLEYITEQEYASLNDPDGTIRRDNDRFAGGYRGYNANGTLGMIHNLDYDAAVAMAYGDYIHNRCLLTEIKFDLELSDEEAILRDMQLLTVPSRILSATIALPTAGIFGSAIVWESSNDEVVNALTGAVSRPERGSPTITLKLMAKLTLGIEARTKEFYVAVESDAADIQIKANSDASLLNPPLFVTSGDIALPTSGTFGSAIAWISSDTNIITNVGVVTYGEEENVVTLMAIVANGDATASRTFEVRVGMSSEAIERLPANVAAVTRAVYQAREYYHENRALTASYWDVWNAKSVLGEDFDKYSFSTYNVKMHKNKASWKGTDIGAVILQIVAQGDNPWNYQGVNYVDLAYAYIDTANRPGSEEQKYYWGMYGEPIFLAMGIDAAGAMTPEIWRSVRTQLIYWTSSLSIGPDLGAWALVLLAKYDDLYLSESAVRTKDVFDAFHDLLVPKIDKTSTGENLGLIQWTSSTGYSLLVSTAEVAIGSVAAVKAGYTSVDLLNGDDWKTEGKSILERIYEQVFANRKGPYGTGYIIAMGDTFYGENVWTRYNPTPDKWNALLAAANRELAKTDVYSAATKTALQTAYMAALAKEDDEYGFGRQVRNRNSFGHCKYPVTRKGGGRHCEFRHGCDTQPHLH